MGQPMSRLFALLNAYFPAVLRRQHRQSEGDRTGHGITEYSGEEMSSTIGGGKGCGSMSGGAAFFGGHFLMGGELYDTAKPEVFLFGDQQDLELLGTKPVKFPHCSKGVTDSVNVLHALVNVRKDSVKFTKVGRAGGGYSSGFYRLEFIFDCDVSCYVQIHFCAKEVIDEHHQAQIVSRQNQFDSSEKYHFPIGANQQFSHFTFKPHHYDLKMMHWDGGTHFPVVIEIRPVTDQFPEQVQMTMCSIERSSDQSAALILKPMKQKLISNGVVFLMQEIFGIENKENAESTSAEENGAECIICMANPRDTMILPCCHLCICNGCAETLRYKLNNCPICRSPFKALLKIRAMRSSLIGMGAEGGGMASTMRIRREPLTLFEAINGPFQLTHTTTPIISNKTQIMARYIDSGGDGNHGNVITTATSNSIPIASNNPLNFANYQRQASSSGSTSRLSVKKRDPIDRVDLDIEHIELDDLDSKRRKTSHSSFIQYSPGSNSITRRSSPSPPSSLFRAHSPFSTANSSYQSARSIVQKPNPQDEKEGKQRRKEKEKNNKNIQLASAPNLALELDEEEISLNFIQKTENEENNLLKLVKKNGDDVEKRIPGDGREKKRMSEPPPPPPSTSNAIGTKSSIPIKQRAKSTKMGTGGGRAAEDIKNLPIKVEHAQIIGGKKNNN